MGQGGILCPVLQKNHQNKSQKLSKFQNPLIPAPMTWQKNRAFSLLQKTPINHQQTREKHEEAEGVKTHLSQFHQFISTTNS